jgi:hypothetical protein
MNKILIALFFISVSINSFSQVKKLKKVNELILIQDYIQAESLILKVLDKENNLPSALYFSAIIDFKTGKSIDSINKKLSICESLLKSRKYEEYIDDSIDLDFNKKNLEQLKFQVRNFAFENYYKNSSKIDSLILFTKKFIPSDTQKSYIEQRICIIASENAINKNVRVDYIDFINNYSNCSQLNNVRFKLEQLDWKMANNSKNVSAYKTFLSNYPNSIFYDSAIKKIEFFEWQEVLFKDSIKSYYNFINSRPNSPYVNLAKNNHDKLLWEKARNSNDSFIVVSYLNNCFECKNKVEALEILANIEWFFIKKSLDINLLNYFIAKYPNSKLKEKADKIVLRINNDIDNVTFNDSISTWNKKMSLYENSKTKYLRTIVCSGSSGITEIVKKELGSLTNVTEVIIGNYKDILYSALDDDNPSSRNGKRLIANYKGKIGLEIPNIFVTQQLSNNIFLLNGNEIFDSKNIEFKKVRVPNYDFIFDKIKIFPYFRLAYPDFLFSRDYYSRGNQYYKPSYYNSDLVYSIENENLSYLKAWGNQYEINFGTSSNTFLLDNEIYKKNNLQKIEINFDKISSEKNNSSNNDGFAQPVNSEAKIVAFNDSIYVSLFKKEKILKLYNINNEKVDTISLKFHREINEFLHFEIDQYGKYLYVEFVTNGIFADNKNSGYINRKYFSVYDCKSMKLVYIGPYIGMQSTTEKIGWVMTKATTVILEEEQAVSSKIESINMFGTSWNPTNIVQNNNYDIYMQSRNVVVLERNLIDLTSILNPNFEFDLAEKILKLTPKEDFFNQEFIKQRVFQLSDSLIKISYLWSKSVEKENYLMISNNMNTRRSYAVEDFIEKYNYPPIINPPVNDNYFIPKLISLTKEEGFKNKKYFNFLIRIDSLPVKLSNIKVNLPNGKYIYRNKEYVGFFKSPQIYVIDSVFCSYEFNIQIDEDDASNAQLLNDLLTKKLFFVSLSSKWSAKSIMSSVELELINEYFKLSKLDSQHYWIDLIKKCNDEGINSWEINLELILEEDSSKWEIPVLLKSPINVGQLNPQY